MGVEGRIVMLAGVVCAGVAWAATEDAPLPDGPAPTRIHCQSFEVELGQPVDTRDRQSPVGTWVIDLESRGWQVRSVDIDIAQKPTGFSQGWAHVCLEPVPGR